jgi:CMP-N,N'-diacetyllegionaminic acid synthase
MIMHNKIITAIITARGGSKGLPRKNIRQLNGKPLIAYSILAARGCGTIDRCVVSTDDEEIAAISRKWGAEVLMRPPELAQDTSTSEDAVCHVIQSIKKIEPFPDMFVLLQPTSPLRNSKHLFDCVTAFNPESFNSAISITETEHHPFKSLRCDNNSLEPLFELKYLGAPRQQLPKIFRPNGAIYLAKTDLFLARKTFFIEPVMPFFMDARASVDIDADIDLIVAETLLKKNLEEKPS